MNDERRRSRTALKLVLCLVISIAAGLVWLWPRHAYLSAEPVAFTVERLQGNPIVHAGMSESLGVPEQEKGYININGPSLIQVPAWIEDPLGKYYLYFAHHKGDHIRLAYANYPTGPWKLHEPGSLQLADSRFPTQPPDRAGSREALSELWNDFSIYVFRDHLILVYRLLVADPAIRKERGMPASESTRPHIASPDVLIDEENERLLMYFHGLYENGSQLSRVAVSEDGIHFTAQPETIPSTYLRGFEYRDEHYLLGMPGVLYRSADAEGPFEPRDHLLFEPDMRHSGLWLDDSTLHVFWSRVGDTPERILLSTVDLGSDDWDEWQATEPVEVIRPELPWEGSELPVLSSLRGEMSLAAHELRDPFVFADEDGQKYLLYVGSGEQAIGIARLKSK